VPIEFLSLNGPDNAGKTTQIRLLSEARPALQSLGSAHEHAPHLWRVPPGDSADWWFETSTTAELTYSLLESHRLRAEARRQGTVAIIDRGHSMLVATAIATCIVKDKLSCDDARAAVEAVQGTRAEPPPEHSLLLLLSRDFNESIAISQARDPREWDPRYLLYQRTLHEVLMMQAESGRYTQVMEWGTRSRAEIHSQVLAAADAAVSDRFRASQ
jgi:hypothetical protein